MTDNEMPDLLPCPFCDAEPSIYTREWESHYRTYIECLRCTCSVSAAQQSRQDSRNSAEDRWNTRTDKLDQHKAADDIQTPPVCINSEEDRYKAALAEVRESVINEVVALLNKKIEIFKSPEYAYPNGCLNSIVVTRGLIEDIKALATLNTLIGGE